LLVALAAITLAISGCAASHRVTEPTRSSPTTGVLTGTLMLRGPGPTQTDGVTSQAEAGTVRLIGAHRRRIDVPTDNSGRFSVRVPEGRYSIVARLKSAKWRWPRCGGPQTIVSARRAEDVEVVCTWL
jgi:hypothetical protein